MTASSPRPGPRTPVVARRSPLLPAVLLPALLAWAVLSGRFPVAPSQLIAVLGSGVTGAPVAVPAQVETVIWQIRLPRVLAGAAIGAALAASGASFQTIFRNPLVSPDILGVSAGAGFGAALGLLLGLPITMIQLLSFVFGLLAVTVAHRVATVVRRHDPTLVLVLSGVVVGALLGACTSLVKYLADSNNTLPSIVFWMMGSLASISNRDLAHALPPILLGVVPLWLLRFRISVLSLGDEEAQSLGVDVGTTRAWVVGSTTLLTAAAVSISGIIGWIGLIVPHMARFLVGPDFALLLPVSMILGADFLLIIDTLARTLIAAEVPIGILTSIVGAPVFLYLLTTSPRTWR